MRLSFVLFFFLIFTLGGCAGKLVFVAPKVTTQVTGGGPSDNPFSKAFSDWAKDSHNRSLKRCSRPPEYESRQIDTEVYTSNLGIDGEPLLRGKTLQYLVVRGELTCYW